MEKSLSFFRVFDIAFFAPGILLFAAIWYHFSPEIAVANISIGEIKDNAPLAIAVMTVSVALIYLFGLLCHALQRVLWEFVFRRFCPTPPTHKSWFQALDRAACEELALYFWYMRATCWNLAIAVSLSSFLVFSCFPGILLGLVASFALGWLGLGFHKSLYRAFQLEHLHGEK